VVDQLKLVSVEEGRDLRLELLLLIYTGKKNLILIKHKSA
jgi:hypothetical protein